MDPYRQWPSIFLLVRSEHAHVSYPGQGGKRPGSEMGSPLLGQCVMRRKTGTGRLYLLSVKRAGPSKKV